MEFRASRTRAPRLLTPARFACVLVAALGMVAPARAATPLTADPFSEAPVLFPNDGGPGDNFGTAVAVSGNTMVVGAPDDNDGTLVDEGAAFVYTQTSPGLWADPVVLTGDPTDGHADGFGTAVAIASDGTIAVGEPDAGTGGAVYAFTPDGAGGYVKSPELAPANVSSLADFGADVAADGDTIAVGARAQNDSGNTAEQYGSVYMYTTPASGGWTGPWSAPVEIPSPLAENGDAFGAAVAVSGLTVFIGTPQAGSPDHSAVFSYSEENASDDFKVSDLSAAKLPSPSFGSVAQSQFGGALAVDYDTLVVGAPATAGDGGAAYVYAVPTSGNIGAATLQSELTPPLPAPGDQPWYGTAVAVQGRRLVIGAVGQFDAYGYDEPSGGWSNATNGTALAQNWGGVGVSGDTVVIGDPLGDNDASVPTGAVHSFRDPAVNLIVGLSPAAIVADRVASTIATASVTDAAGNPLSGDAVSFSASDPGVKIGPVTDNGNGTYRVTITGSATPGDVTVTATDISAGPAVSGQATLTQTGAGLISAPPASKPTRRQLLASLSGLLTPTGRQARLRAILRRGGYTFTYRALESGRLAIRWLRVVGHRTVLVATGSARVKQAGKVALKVKLVSNQRHLFRNARSLRLSSRVSLTVPGDALTRSKSFTLHA